MGVYFQADFNTFYRRSLNFNEEILIYWQITHLFCQITKQEQERGFWLIAGREVWLHRSG